MTVTFEERHFRSLAPQRAQLPAAEALERTEVRELLLQLDDTMPPARFPRSDILGRDLHRHWSPEHRTALWYPHAYNGFRVDEIYLRYGKSRSQIISLRTLIPPADDEPPDLGGFPAHVHIGVGLVHNAFFYQLVIGPRAWPDLNTLHGAILARHSETFEYLRTLAPEGYELFWSVTEPRSPDSFASPAELAEYVRNPPDATPGRDWFVIGKRLPAADGRIRVTTDEVVEEVQNLYPLFDAAARRSP